MGLFRKNSESNYPNEAGYKKEIEPGNPDPQSYHIVESKQIGNCLVVLINYPNCKNFEGNKILLYLNTTIEELILQKHIDPHFSNNKKFKSPFARFQPTILGWSVAKQVAKQMKDYP